PRRNSHVGNCPEGSILGQAEAVEAIAAMPGCCSEDSIPDHYQFAQWPRSLCHGGSVGRSQHDGLPSYQALSRPWRMGLAGRPRPTVGCPWSPAAKASRLRALRQLVAALPRQHMLVYEDEVDIHLNPKIGWDWMVRAQQKEVVTPGQNVKRYLAGAWNVRTGLVSWVEGERKNSALFIALLDQLVSHYPQVPVIH